MKDRPSNADQPERLREENDPLWQLLGESPRPEPDAWFAVRTLARCRYAAPKTVSWWSYFANWQRVLGTSVGLGLAVILVVMQIRVPTHSTGTDKQQNVQEAFAIMASLNSSADSDSTSSSSSSSSWPDQSL